MTAPRAARRAWRAPEVVQTSAMDCGPAALKCVLEGHGIPVSYGRLREACQTDVDGTSIDALEAVTPQLGLATEQVMIPLDHVLLPDAGTLPAIVVVRQPDGATHFVVAWRRVGPWLQVMDPAHGRRWQRAERFRDDVFQHAMPVGAADWRAWAGSAEFTRPLALRLAALGLAKADAATLVARAAADAGWFGFGALDACARLVQSVVAAGGLAAGRDAARLLHSAFERTLSHPEDIHRSVPAGYWSVAPIGLDDDGRLQLRLSGAVLLRVTARLAATEVRAQRPASRELRAALRESQPHPLLTLARLLRRDGVFAPAALVGATVLAAGALVVEALLFRGLFDIAGQLALGSQRALALAALLAFVVLLMVLELPIIAESLRLGRKLEARLRMALLTKLPRLSDRYFQSRSVSDMAERSHSLQLLRQVPSLGLGLVQSVAELSLTLVGVALIAPASLGWAAAIAGVALALPFAAQPWLAERDLRARSHQSALHAFMLDALLALVPVRAHRAETAMRRQHEGLVVAWTQATRSLIVASLATGGLQSLLCLGLAGAMLVRHFHGTGAVGGSDLLLVYWALKLPALGGRLGGLVAMWPGQRNVLLRMLEPLTAPEDPPPVPAPAAKGPVRGVALQIEQGRVVAAGHEILRHLNLSVAAGEQVAIVGTSGAGKSSLVGLFLGWHRLAGGRLRIDGAEAGASEVAGLRPLTAWVDPGVQLWNASLADNLGYAAEPASMARLGTVLDAADLRGVLNRLPQGLQTPLGEGGALLSGGEGQRVRFGRAMLQSGVRLVLLDEPFRGLDRAQRSRLLGRARRWWQGATLLCVTHDVGETLGFDRVLVVDGGRVVEDGAPLKLAAQAGSCYAALLAADADVQQRLWRGTQWRRVRVEGGRVVDGGTR